MELARWFGNVLKLSLWVCGCNALKSCGSANGMRWNNLSGFVNGMRWKLSLWVSGWIALKSCGFVNEWNALKSDGMRWNPVSSWLECVHQGGFVNGICCNSSTVGLECWFGMQIESRVSWNQQIPFTNPLWWAPSSHELTGFETLSLETWDSSLPISLGTPLSLYLSGLLSPYPPAPMNHVKYLRAGPPDMPLRNWYNCSTKHFHLTSVVRWKWKNQLDWVIKPVPHDLVRRIRFWRIKISGTWF